MLSNEDIGGIKVGGATWFGIVGLPGMYPFVIMPGPHGYMIHPIDLTERAAINKEYEDMLARLCEINKEWCLPNR